jgi:hypothetical protein
MLSRNYGITEGKQARIKIKAKKKACCVTDDDKFLTQEGGNRGRFSFL